MHALDAKTKIYNPFPSLIYHTHIDIDLALIEEAVLELANSMHQPHEIWNLWYSHYSAPSLEKINPVFNNLKNLIVEHTERFHKATHDRREQMILNRMWGAVYKTGGNMRPHTHHETAYSACFYVKNTLNGKITFTHPSSLRFNATVDFTPKEGELLIWPGWLMHEVPPVIDNDIRITVPAKLDFASPKLSLENRQVDTEYI